MTDPLAPLLTRYSVGTRYLRGPAPSQADLLRMTEAALRAPDHAGLVPFRLAVIRDEARAQLADLFEAAALVQGKSADQAAGDRLRATDPPLLVAVIARIDAGHPVATVHEQWIALGGALSNFLTAAHALGYGGKMLSGGKVRAQSVMAAFCQPGESLVGWMVLGTPRGVGQPRYAKPAPDEVMSLWTGPPTGRQT